MKIRMDRTGDNKELRKKVLMIMFVIILIFGIKTMIVNGEEIWEYVNKEVSIFDSYNSTYEKPPVSNVSSPIDNTGFVGTVESLVTISLIGGVAMILFTIISSFIRPLGSGEL